MSDPVLTPKSPPPIPEKSSLGMASMVLGLLAIIAATASIYFLFQSDADRAFKIAVTVISFLIGLAAAVMGLTTIFGRTTGHGFAVSGTLCGGVSVIAIALTALSIPIGAFIADMRSIPPAIVERPPIIIDPIEIPEGSKTVYDVRAAWKSWLLANAIEPKKLEITGDWNEEVTGKILDAYLADWIIAPDQPTQQDWNRLYAELTDLRRYGEPFSRLLLSGKAQLPRDLAALVTPIKSLREKETNPFWLLILELQSAEARTDSKSTSGARASDERALDAFEQLLEEQWFTGDDWWLLADLTNFAWFPGFFDRNTEDVIEILETHDVPEWFLHYMKGRQFHRAAWDARGSGMAYTVTEEGWVGFREYMKKARAELEKSWELAPDIPFAAAKMVSVAMADSEDPISEMRLWLDRVIVSQCDYWPAYNNWLWGMHPRWHGTHDAMLEFGEQCLATERFDTNVPSFYRSTIAEIASDSDMGIYSKEGVYDNLCLLFEKQIANARDERERRRWRTFHAVTAFRNGRFDELQEPWRELDGNPDVSILKAWSITPEIIETRAAIGKGTGKVQKAILAERADEPGEAAEHYRAALKEDDRSEEEKSAIARRLAIVELEDRYASGEWIELIPGPPDLWRSVEGSFQVENDGSYAVTSDTIRFAIEHPMEIGQYCEIEWEIDTPDDQIAAIGPGVMLSSSRFDTLKWNAFYVSQIDGNRQYKVSRFRYRSDMRVNAEKKDRVTMRLVCNRKKWLAYVDGEKVHRGDIDLNVSFFGEESRLALGAFTTSPTKNFVTRYHRLRVRKLPEPEVDEESAEE